MEVVSNITNEILFVGSIFKKPDLFIEYGHNIRSKYDFYDEATKFFYDNAEILEMAQMICEATGADAYTSLVANDDFIELLSGVVGVPTTFFIDGNGVFVGSHVVGANVESCKEIVEAYLAQ